MVRLTIHKIKILLLSKYTCNGHYKRAQKALFFIYIKIICYVNEKTKRGIR